MRSEGASIEYAAAERGDVREEVVALLALGRREPEEVKDASVGCGERAIEGSLDDVGGAPLGLRALWERGAIIVGEVNDMCQSARGERTSASLAWRRGRRACCSASAVVVSSACSGSSSGGCGVMVRGTSGVSSGDAPRLVPSGARA